MLQWCTPIGLRKSTVARTLQKSYSQEGYVIGVDIFKGKGKYSKSYFAVLTPRYELYNQTSSVLRVTQCFSNTMDDTQGVELFQNATAQFHWESYNEEKKICVEIHNGIEPMRSQGFQIFSNQSIFINVRNPRGESKFLRLETIRYRARLFLVFLDAENLPPPIRIDNYASVALKFYQAHLKSPITYTVKSNTSKAYVLDDVNIDEVLCVEGPGGMVCQCPLNDYEPKFLTYENFIYIAFMQRLAG